MSISIKERRALERAAMRLVSAAIDEARLAYARDLGAHHAGLANAAKATDAAEKAFRALLDKLSEPDVKR